LQEIHGIKVIVLMTHKSCGKVKIKVGPYIEVSLVLVTLHFVTTAMSIGFATSLIMCGVNGYTLHYGNTKHINTNNKGR
jgi:hypothetical protein